MKRVLTGVSNNIATNIKKINVWAQSFKKYVEDGEVVLIAADMTEQDKEVLNRIDIKYFEVQTDRSITVNDSRIRHTADWLEQSDYGSYLVTDVFDVCFQGNPFDMFNTEKYDFYVASEGVLHSEEPWNMDVMNKTFPEYVNFIRPFEVVCSGVIGGTKSSLLKTLRLQQELINKALHGHDIRDQAALNILLHNGKIDRAKVFTPKDGWAVHCALAGPTFQHKEWGLGRSIADKYGSAKLEDRRIVTAERIPFKIAHQYNRIPEWNRLIVEEYE